MLDFESGINITPQFVLNIIAKGLPLVGLVPALVANLKSIPSIDTVAAEMPEKYSKAGVDAWIEKYSML